MRFADAMIYFDYNMSKMAKETGYSHQAIWLWKKEGTIPYPAQCVIQIQTKGLLKADRKHCLK